MDYLFRTVEAAQKQAQSLSQQASQSAKGFAEQVSTHTKTLATQAASASNIAAEQAGQRWKELNIQETFKLSGFDTARSGSAEPGPSEAELEAFGITPGFQDFVRSLTYSTFRDFPLEHVPAAAPEGGSSKVLTRWQEQHALLIVQKVKEINELRFVLCPKRMNDAQFWGVYFLLAKKHLPPEAFTPDTDIESTETSDAHSALLELQLGLKKTFETARETAKTWTTKASGVLQPADASGPLHEMVESHRSHATNGPSGGLNGAKSSTQAAVPKEADIDQDLEAYLRTMSEEQGVADDAAASEHDGSEEATDLDEYLNELEVKSNQSDVETGHESEDYLDVPDAVKESAHSVGPTKS